MLNLVAETGQLFSSAFWAGLTALKCRTKPRANLTVSFLAQIAFHMSRVSQISVVRHLCGY